jgi:predicted nucleic acid-binding protein
MQRPTYAGDRAKQYAIIANVRERAGKPIPGFDALIAAVCRSRNAALATRHVPDFDGVGIEVIDPWAAAGA